MYRWLRLAFHLILGAEVDHELQTLNIDALRLLATEEIREVALCLGIRIGNRALERCAGKADHWPQSDRRLLILELAKLTERLRVDGQLEHVEDLPLEEAHEGQAVGALLAVVAEDHERGVVLLAEELERIGILEGVDIVLLVELDRKRLLQRLQIGQGPLRDLAT